MKKTHTPNAGTFRAGENHALRCARKGAKASPWSRGPMVASPRANRMWDEYAKTPKPAR